MKILIIRNFPTYMMVENNTYNIQEVGLAKALVRKGNICDIVFWTDKEERDVIIPVDDCGYVHVFYRRGKTKLKNTIFCGCEELFKQYDILQPCEYNQIQSWILAKQYSQKTVIYHGPYYSKFNKRYNLMCKVFDVLFLKRYIKWGTRFIVKSNMAQEFLVKKGINEKNISDIGVGIDVQMLSTGDSSCKEDLSLQMEKDSDKLKILYVGRLEKRRNIPLILETFSKVYEKKKNAMLYVVGTGEEDYVRVVLNYAKELGIDKQIVWKERMEQKYLSNIYKYADFFLLPTEYEIFGMVLLEAMYYRTIVLTTRNGGSSTLIRDGENGFIVENENPAVWAENILRISENKTLMETIGNNASAFIAENFTWDALADKFLEQYSMRLE